MYHQPFETWILEEEALSNEETQSLMLHLETCSQCKKLHDNWQAAEVRLSTAKMASPSAGFSSRWQQTLRDRLEEQKMKQVLQVRRFFLYLGTANILSLIIFAVLFIAGGSTMNMLASFAGRIANLTLWVDRIEGWLFAVLNVAPTTVPLAIWVALTSIFSILALIWIVSLWRITFQGAKSR